jgi:glycosyltransferase involved in cell wall biosynthesis
MTVTIAVITATLNAARYLPSLIDSLASQTDRRFEWIVADGGSTDGTIDLVTQAASRLASVSLTKEKDCGIYHAFNKAIQSTDSDYYLVAGADDIFYPNAINDYKMAIMRTGGEFVSAGVVVNGQVVRYRRPKLPSLYGAFALVSSHSIGLAIKRSIHDRSGLYDTRYRICSDNHFILRAIKNKAVITHADFIAGEFSTGGLSNSNQLESYCEQFMAQVETGSSPFIQAGFLVTRIYKHKLQNMFSR